MLRTALISVTSLSVVMSALIFIIGFVCGHCFNQRWRKSADKNDGSSSDPIAEPGEDLELRKKCLHHYTSKLIMAVEKNHGFITKLMIVHAQTLMLFYFINNRHIYRHSSSHVFAYVFMYRSASI